MWRVTACETLPDYCAARKFQPDPNLNFVVETIGLCVCAATELQDMAQSRVVGSSIICRSLIHFSTHSAASVVRQRWRQANRLLPFYDAMKRARFLFSQRIQ